MKVALVCDWLTNFGGGEKVLLELHKLYPDAPIYTSKYDPKGIDWFADADVRTGRLQKFPTKLRRILGPFRQWYFSHLNLAEYDLVISVTGAEAKSVKSGKWLHEHGSLREKRKIEKRGGKINPKGIHISYCHVPTQYYWQMYDDYVKNPGFGALNPLVRFCFKLIVGPLKKADLKAAQRPDYYVTISKYAKDLIRKYYGRTSTIIHPPVEVEEFRANAPRSSVFASPATSYYITTSRQVNWKRIDLVVWACMMTQRKLVVIGDGPEHKKLVKMAEGSGLVEFLPVMKKEKLAQYLAHAKGYLFPSLEPFGIAPVEALAVGCPVIAYDEGGARDYIQNGKNGLFFKEQTAKSLAEAILKFEKMKFRRKEIEKSAEKFDTKRFDREVKDFISEKKSK